MLKNTPSRYATKWLEERNYSCHPLRPDLPSLIWWPNPFTWGRTRASVSRQWVYLVTGAFEGKSISAIVYFSSWLACSATPVPNRNVLSSYPLLVPSLSLDHAVPITVSKIWHLIWLFEDCLGHKAVVAGLPCWLASGVPAVSSFTGDPLNSTVWYIT